MNEKRKNWVIYWDVNLCINYRGQLKAFLMFYKQIWKREKWFGWNECSMLSGFSALAIKKQLGQHFSATCLIRRSCLFWIKHLLKLWSMIARWYLAFYYQFHKLFMKGWQVKEQIEDWLLKIDSSRCICNIAVLQKRKKTHIFYQLNNDIICWCGQILISLISST
jgi:hypothetical protein